MSDQPSRRERPMPSHRTPNLARPTLNDGQMRKCMLPLAAMLPVLIWSDSEGPCRLVRSPCSNPPPTPFLKHDHVHVRIRSRTHPPKGFFRVMSNSYPVTSFLNSQRGQVEPAGHGWPPISRSHVAQPYHRPQPALGPRQRRRCIYSSHLCRLRKR